MIGSIEDGILVAMPHEPALFGIGFVHAIAGVIVASMSIAAQRRKSVQTNIDALMRKKRASTEEPRN